MGVLVDSVRSMLADTVRSFTLGFKSSDREFGRLWGGAPTQSGVAVTTENVTGLSAVWACVTLIAGTIGAKVPLALFHRDADGSRARASDHPLYTLLHDRPSHEQHAAQFWECMTTALLLRGNAYAEIVRGARGVQALLYLHPDRVTPARETSTGPIVYRVSNNSRPESVLSASDILHVVGPMSDDGIAGKSVITAARESFGEAIAHQQFGAAFFGHGASPGGILTHPGHMTEPAKATFKAFIKEQYAGADRAHQLLLLEEGITYQQVTISPEDAQFIEGRRFSVEDIARLFGTPVHLIGGSREGLTYSNSETEALHFLKFTLGPWLGRIAGAVNFRLIEPDERGRLYAEHVPDALLATDTAGRFTAYRQALGSSSVPGWMTVDEIRQRENLPPMPRGAA